ncbi:hypothetical protein Y032_0131g1599 [Ancylostoma ceylanicum]|nr:hypothetical protein Y032_0131g1599 [Ancylostoma ceylanicum]
MIIDKSSVLPPYFRFREEYLVVKKYHLATCQIEKVMTTIRDGIFCYLTDSKNFTMHNRTISKEYWKNRMSSNISLKIIFCCVFMFICCMQYMEVSVRYQRDRSRFQLSLGNSTVLPPFIRFREDFLVNPDYHLATCQIEKVMTTVREGIFRYLTDPRNFSIYNRTISKEHWKNRFCSGMDYVRTNMTAVLNDIGEEPVLFAVVREPIERFLSGFLDKCIFENDYDGDTSDICYGCVDDIHCFVDELYRRLQERKKENKREYYHSRHFAPQTWYCDFQNYLANYTIVKYAKGKKGNARLAEQFDSIFKRAYVPDTLREVIRNELLKGSTSHSTHSSEESRRLKEAFFSDPSLVRKVVQIYFYDFIVFHFPFPQLPQ